MRVLLFLSAATARNANVVLRSGQSRNCCGVCSHSSLTTLTVIPGGFHAALPKGHIREFEIFASFRALHVTINRYAPDEEIAWLPTHDRDWIGGPRRPEGRRQGRSPAPQTNHRRYQFVADWKETEV